MLDREKVLAVIPARGGSKRFPGKNLAVFRGLALIEWAVRAADESEHIDKTVLSTEDQTIKAAALALDIEVIDRPSHLATDTAASVDVMRHALSVYPDHNWIVLLQPTSPLRTAEDVDKCIQMCRRGNACVSVGPDGQSNGAVYVALSGWLERGHNFQQADHIIHYAMPADRSLDIDYEWQLK